MVSRRQRVWYVLIAVALLAGCSQRGWYEGVKQSHRFQCSQVPQSEREDCLARHEDSYEEYRRRREGVEE